MQSYSLLCVCVCVCVRARAPVNVCVFSRKGAAWVEAEPPKLRLLGTPGPILPILSISVNMEDPLHNFIYYVNDYIAHCLAIVSLMDLIKLGLFTAGDI